MRLLFCATFFGLIANSFAQVNIDSILTVNYHKTLRDSVFQIGDKVRTSDIQFDLSGPLLTQIGDSSLKELASFLIKNPFLIVEIVCYTDTRGNETNNQRLSLYRAKSVIDKLVERYACNEIFAERFTAVGKGESDPIVSEDYIQNFRHDLITVEKLHQVNRRFEVKITGFLGKEFYKNRGDAASHFDMSQSRNPAYYEDLIRIADYALLEGNYDRALEFYTYAADLAPANELYAAQQREKVKELLGQSDSD